jgi:hypothetical protein
MDQYLNGETVTEKLLVGQRKVVDIAVRGVQGRRRWSKLRELLAVDEAAFASRPN